MGGRSCSGFLRNEVTNCAQAPRCAGREGPPRGCCPRPVRRVLKHASASHPSAASYQEKGRLAFKNKRGCLVSTWCLSLGRTRD